MLAFDAMQRFFFGEGFAGTDSSLKRAGTQAFLLPLRGTPRSSLLDMSESLQSGTLPHCQLFGVRRRRFGRSTLYGATRVTTAVHSLQ